MNKYHMNYEKIYYSVIRKGLERGLDKKLFDVYLEKHHIVPKCVGGTNDESNLVLLTAKEHYICHLLLTKMYPTSKGLWVAMDRLMHGNKKFISELHVSAKTTEYYKMKANEERSYYSSLREHGEHERNIISEKAKKRWSGWRENGRIKEVSKNISEKTKLAMMNEDIRNKTRINAGSKWYTNKKTGESMHWYPGNPLPDENIWIPGRPSMKTSARMKISEGQKGKICYYYNDELKENRRFMKDEEVPEGWKKGRRIIYSRKQVWRH